ncbi:MAG: hypothetical protein V8T86_08035 [Victivallis sp.]
MGPAVAADPVTRRNQVGTEIIELVDDPVEQIALEGVGQPFPAEPPQPVAVAAEAERVVETDELPGEVPDIVFRGRIEASGFRRRRGVLEVAPQPEAEAFDDGAVFVLEHPGRERFAEPVEDFRFAVHGGFPFQYSVRSMISCCSAGEREVKNSEKPVLRISSVRYSSGFRLAASSVRRFTTVKPIWSPPSSKKLRSIAAKRSADGRQPSFRFSPPQMQRRSGSRETLAKSAVGLSRSAPC